MERARAGPWMRGGFFREGARAAAAAAVLALAGSLAAPAEAQTTIAPRTAGAALAIPYLTTPAGGGERITVASVTNSFEEQAITLHLIWISGDPDDDWAALDTPCSLTPHETTYFIHEATGGGGAFVRFECSAAGVTDPDPNQTNNARNQSVPGADGILFVALECQAGFDDCPSGPMGPRTLPDNALIGSSTVIDFGQGFAFAVDALHIQGLSNDGDRLYEFDGLEYAAFPSLLTGTYVAPDDDITLELLAFTLDGKSDSGPGINVNLTGYAYDDDENFTSGAVKFDCFTLQDLTAFPSRGFGSSITRTFGGHTVGHIQLFPSVTLANDPIENNPATGDSNGVRRRPAHGWIIQTLASGGDFADGAFPLGGATSASRLAWARRLVAGTNPLIPVDGDKPAFDSP